MSMKDQFMKKLNDVKDAFNGTSTSDEPLAHSTNPNAHTRMGRLHSKPQHHENLQQNKSIYSGHAKPTDSVPSDDDSLKSNRDNSHKVEVPKTPAETNKELKDNQDSTSDGNNNDGNEGQGAQQPKKFSQSNDEFSKDHEVHPFKAILSIIGVAVVIFVLICMFRPVGATHSQPSPNHETQTQREGIPNDTVSPDNPDNSTQHDNDQATIDKCKRAENGTAHLNGSNDAPNQHGKYGNPSSQNNNNSNTNNN